MVTLIDENKNALRAFRGVRVVKFKEVGAIGQQLTIAAGPTSMLNPAAAPFIPAQATPQATADSSIEATGDEVNEDSVILAAAEEEETETPEETDVAAIFESIGTNVTGPSAEVLVEQNSAAQTLQSYYRRLQSKRKKRIANPGLGLPKTRQNQFEAFTQAAESIEWPPKSLYRPIFLGALPHLLTCLDYTYSIVWEEKKRVKQVARRSEKHQGIEGHLEQRTKLTYVHKWRKRMRS
jgi:hypothetical protein